MSDQWFYVDIAALIGATQEEATMSGNTGPFERPFGPVLQHYPHSSYDDAYQTIDTFVPLTPDTDTKKR